MLGLQNKETKMELQKLSSFTIHKEDKEWLKGQAEKSAGSVNSVLRKLVRDARERDERKEAKR